LYLYLLLYSLLLYLLIPAKPDPRNEQFFGTVQLLQLTMV
jgi:hypothetical protein